MKIAFNQRNTSKMLEKIAILILLIAFSFCECMRPNSPLQDQSSHQGNPGSFPPSHPSTSTTSSSHYPRMRPLRTTATERMKPVSGLSDSRYVAGQQYISDSSGTKKLKGVSHTGVLGNSKSQFDYPKLTLKAGRVEGGIISHFHHMKENPRHGPYEYLQHRQPDTIDDQANRARTLPLGFRKHDQPDIHTFNSIKDWSSNPKHPKASLAYAMPADPSANHKRPRVDVEGGKYYGHLVTMLYGPESPHKQNNPSQPSSSNNHGQASMQDNAFAQSLLRSQTPSRDSGGSSKRRRIKDEPQ